MIGTLKLQNPGMGGRDGTGALNGVSTMEKTIDLKLLAWILVLTFH